MRRLLVILAALVLVLAACGGDDDDPVVEGGSDTTAAAGGQQDDIAEAATVQVAETDLGEVLVDAEGMTLYLFTRDSEGESACTGQCLEVWPPLTVEGEPTAGDGVDDAKLGTITRDDGSTQVTYNGHPLYFYAPDQNPGDTTGQGVQDVWFVVSPAGDAIESQAASEPAGY